MDARRLLPIAAAVTALLVVAGIASHGRPLSSSRGAGPSATFFDYVATTLVVFAVGMLVLVLVLLLTSERTGRRGVRRRGRWDLVSALVMFAAASLVAVAISRSEFQKRLHELAQGKVGQQPNARTGTTKAVPKNVRNARIRWDEIAIVAVLVGGVIAYFVVTRRPRLPLRPLARRRDELSRALDESLDDLRSDPDVRRAIIAAYARMERTLASAGVRRAPAETPFEFLERSLLELEAGAEAARRLTDLFERAKFSHHEPDEAMRDEAVDALIAVRDDLRREQPQPVVA